MVEGDGLENRCRGDSTVSSNLTSSAILLSLISSSGYVNIAPQ